MKNLKFSSMLFFMVTAFAFTACGGDDDEDGGDYSSVVGIWSGTGNNGKRSVQLTLNADRTGTEEVQWNNVRWSRKYAVFTYTFSGNKIKCKGTYTSADSDGNSEEGDFNDTFTYNGSSITTPNYNNIELTR